MADDERPRCPRCAEPVDGLHFTADTSGAPPREWVTPCDHPVSPEEYEPIATAIQRYALDHLHSRLAVDDLPPPTPGAGWAGWEWTDISEYVKRNDPPKLTVSPSQATFTPTGGLYYPPPPLRFRLVRRRPWWKFWRRRG